MRVGLVRSLQPPDILWIHWIVYNSIANLPSSDVMAAVTIHSDFRAQREEICH